MYSNDSVSVETLLTGHYDPPRRRWGTRLWPPSYPSYPETIVIMGITPVGVSVLEIMKRYANPVFLDMVEEIERAGTRLLPAPTVILNFPLVSYINTNQILRHSNGVSIIHGIRHIDM